MRFPKISSRKAEMPSWFEANGKVHIFFRNYNKYDKKFNFIEYFYLSDKITWRNKFTISYN